MYPHLATPSLKVGQGDNDTRIVYWWDETTDLGFDLGFDWRVRKKQKSISYSNISWVRMYGKLRLNAWHQAIKTILEYYQVAHQSKKTGVELYPLPKMCNAEP